MSSTKCVRTLVLRRALALLVPALFLLSVAKAERPPAPSVRLPLEALGFPGYTTNLIRSGRSMTTLHLLDSHHLLFTFSERTLVPRIPGDDENDADRLVAAEVVEMPSGKVLARTEWHLHDYGRYLWSIGHGMFVLRIRNDLSVFSPMRGLATDAAFQRTALPHHAGVPEVISASADGAMLMIESAEPTKEEPVSGDSEDEGASRRKHVVIDFYRLLAPVDQDRPMELKLAGAMGSPGPMMLALDGDGYLWADDKPQHEWSVSFNEYEGKAQDLTAVRSSCAPRLHMLSRSQFLVMSCRGSDDAHLLAAYGLDGHETWEEPFRG